MHALCSWKQCSEMSYTLGLDIHSISKDPLWLSESHLKTPQIPETNKKILKYIVRIIIELYRRTIAAIGETLN